MGHFLLSRVIQSMLTILVISMVVFVMARATGDPVTLLASTNATAQDIATLKEQLGLDQPVVVQYWVFITNAARGNLGKSLATKSDVAQQIGERLPNSPAIGLPALVLSAARADITGPARQGSARPAVSPSAPVGGRGRAAVHDQRGSRDVGGLV